MSMRVGVLVHCRNNSDVSLGCFDSLREQTYTNTSIIAFSNGSDPAYPAAFGDDCSYYISDDVVPLATAYNVMYSMCQADCEAFFLLDATQRVEPDCIERAATIISRDPQHVGLVYFDEFGSVPRPPFSLDAMIRNDIIGRNYVFSRCAAEHVGLFEARMGLAFHYDFSLRVCERFAIVHNAKRMVTNMADISEQWNRDKALAVQEATFRYAKTKT